MTIAPLPPRPAHATTSPRRRPDLFVVPSPGASSRTPSAVVPSRPATAAPVPETAADDARDTQRDPRRRCTSALLAFAQGLPEPEVRQPVLARVVDANMPVAEAVAARYRRRGVAAEDVQQAAYEGLCKAVRRFDPAQAEDLLTFAVPTIRGEVQRYFRDHSWVVRPPRRLQELSARAREVREEAGQELGREPTLEQLAERLGVDVGTCDQALQASEAMHVASLDQPVGPSGTARISDLLGEEDQLERIEDHLVLRPLLAALGPREQQLLHLRFVEERSQFEIGEVLGVTQTQVSRLLRRVLGDLRSQLEANVAERTDDGAEVAGTG